MARQRGCDPAASHSPTAALPGSLKCALGMGAGGGGQCRWCRRKTIKANVRALCCAEPPSGCRAMRLDVTDKCHLLEPQLQSKQGQSGRNNAWLPAESRGRQQQVERLRQDAGSRPPPRLPQGPAKHPSTPRDKMPWRPERCKFGS